MSSNSIYIFLDELLSNNKIESAVINVLQETAWEDHAVFRSYLDNRDIETTKKLIKKILQKGKGAFNPKIVCKVLDETLDKIKEECF